MLYNRVLKITKVDPVAFYNLRIEQQRNNFRNLRLDQSFALYNTVMFSFFLSEGFGEGGGCIVEMDPVKNDAKRVTCYYIKASQ